MKIEVCVHRVFTAWLLLSAAEGIIYISVYVCLVSDVKLLIIQ